MLPNELLGSLRPISERPDDEKTAGKFLHWLWQRGKVLRIDSANSLAVAETVGEVRRVIWVYVDPKVFAETEAELARDGSWLSATSRDERAFEMASEYLNNSLEDVESNAVALAFDGGLFRGFSPVF